MSIVHLHLLLNHAPVMGVVFAALLLSVAVYRRSDELTKVGLGFLALLAALTIVVFSTGGSAEEAVEKLPGFSQSIAEHHEDAAVAATVLLVAIGVLALVALVVYRRRAIPRGMTVAALVATLGTSGVVAYVANLGGQIRHTEIRADASSTGAARAEPGESREDRENK